MRAVKLGDGILVTYRDMTDLRRAEAAAELMAAIVESTDDAIVGADREGRITHWNPGAGRLLGYEREEIVGQYVRTLVRDEDFESQNARFSRVLAGERVERIETQWVRKDGGAARRRPHRVAAARPQPARSSAPPPSSTTSPPASATRPSCAARTPSSSASPTSPPTTCASRSWPSPSSPRCSSAASTPSARRSSPTCARPPRTAPGSSTACSTSRASGAARRPRSPSTCAGVIEGLLDTLAPQIEAAGARVEVGPLPTVLGVEGELARVFQNLLANALKFRGDAPPVVAVSAARSPREWTLTVADNGPGVSERNRERIFELFARGQVDGQAPGTGLGLAVCRKVVELHGGRIWVEPAPGGGSAFRMTLPV